ncbi:MAG: transposon-encoded TnpW family protein [Eubacterium sp.]|nr:transposon-encoded TnpW family protein [Eubacterium sp.]
MTSKQRIEWYNHSLFNKPINFTKQIDNTVYTVNTHFNETANESVNERIVRILEQSSK